VRSNGATAMVVAIAGLLATLLFSLKAPEERNYRFPVAFVIDKATLLPLSFMQFPAVAEYADPGWGTPGVMTKAPFLNGLTEQVLPSVQPEDINGLLAVYQDVLVSYVMDMMCTTFRGSWNTEVFSFETARVTTHTSEVRGPVRPGLVVERRKLVKDLPHGPVVNDVAGIAIEFTVPEHTAVTWKPTKATEDTTRVLEMSNAFVSLTVTIEREAYVLGSGGLIAFVGTSLEESQKTTFTLSYVMKVHASFERLLSGHPDMPAYTRWVDTLFGLLRQLDAEQRWRRIKQDYLLLRDQQALLLRGMGASGGSPAKPK